MPLHFRKPSWRAIIHVVIGVVIILISLPFVYVGNEYRLKVKYEHALNRLQVGDPEETVVKLMGQPDERNCCYPRPTDHDTAEDKRFHQRCVETYMYVTLMENYGVTFDKDGRVSGKFHQVSP